MFISCSNDLSRPVVISEAAVRALSTHCERPMILALSSPTCELSAAQAYHWSSGKAIYANPCDEIAYRFAQLERLGLGPNMAMYEPGFLQVALAYHRAGKLPRGALVKFYLGGGYKYALHVAGAWPCLEPC